MPGTVAYHELRNSYSLNASDFASAIGVGYKSRKYLWEIKTGRRTEKPDPYLQQMYDWGNDHESDALEALQAHTGMALRRCGIFELDGDGRYAATPDAICLDDGCPCEAKCPYTHGASPIPPLKHWIQMQVQAACVSGGVKGVHYFSWRPEGEACYYTWVPYEPEAFKQIKALADEFVKFVDNDIEPQRLYRRPRFPHYDKLMSHWAVFYVANTKKTQSEIEWHRDEKSARTVFERPIDTGNATKYLCKVFAVDGKHPNESIALQAVVEIPPKPVESND